MKKAPNCRPIQMERGETSSDRMMAETVKPRKSAPFPPSGGSYVVN
jgi:hypothetical protein